MTAISRMYTYVQTLPHDRFTRLLPFFEFERRDIENPREKLMAGLFGGHTTKGHIIATLHMPHLTPYREPIQGELIFIVKLCRLV